MSYAATGVDIAAAEENVRRIGHHVRSTHGPAVLGDFGAFAGLFHLRDVRSGMGPALDGFAHQWVQPGAAEDRKSVV